MIQNDEKSADILDLLTINTDPKKFNFGKNFDYIDSDGNKRHIKAEEYRTISSVIYGRLKINGKDGIEVIEEILANERIIHFIRKRPDMETERRRCGMFSARLLEAWQELKCEHGRNIVEAKKKDGKVFGWFDPLVEIKTLRKVIVDLYRKLYFRQAPYWEVENVMDIALSKAKHDLSNLKYVDRVRMGSTGKAARRRAAKQMRQEEQQEEQNGMAQQQSLPALNGPPLALAIRTKRN